MWHRLLDRVDDALIDRFFQPITDIVRRLTGFSKRIPCAVTLLLSAATFIPTSIEMVGSGMPAAVFMGLFNCAVAFTAAYASFVFVSLELYERGRPSRADALNNERVRFKENRRGLLPIGAALVAVGIILNVVDPNYSQVLPIIVGQLLLMAFVYFEACTNLPPRRSILSKLKEAAGKFFLSPAPTP
ncbi:MAG TPA: hypothetical protein VFS75_02875 [Candidatus Paceibacterota bacterium]|nr:hypothetical protein [Candidatus Paceibacterota bacterium]